MNFFIAKIYEVYSKNQDLNALFRTRMYLIALLTSAFSSVSLILFETTSYFLAHKKISLNPLIIITCLLAVVYFSNKFLTKWLTKEKLNEIKNKYKEIQLHPLIVYLFMIVLFLILLLSGPVLSILINGGEFFGERVNGILH